MVRRRAGFTTTTLAVLAMSTSCGEDKLAPSPRVTPPPPSFAPGTGEALSISLRSLRAGESRTTLLAQQVEQEARWDEDRRVANSLKYVFEAEHRVLATDALGPRESEYRIASADGGTGLSLQGARVVIRSEPGGAHVTIDEVRANEEQRAVLAALIAHEGVARNASAVMPPGEQARLGQSWSPDVPGLVRLLARLGAEVAPASVTATCSLTELAPCARERCAHVATQLSATVSETARVSGQLHVWVVVGKREPARKLAWSIAITERGKGGKTPIERKVIQRQDSLVIPPDAEPEKRQP